MQSQKNRYIGIIGLGKTGVSAYIALKNTATVICYDEDEKKRDNFIAQFGNGAVVPLTDLAWLQLDQILLSPGIPLSHPMVLVLQEKNTPIISDLDLFFAECQTVNAQTKIIGITGTNGKSTTTALITHILHAAGLGYPCGGNIGNAVLGLPFDKPGYVLELSSFHLDLIQDLRIKIAVLLNITPDHLDRYGSMEEYVKSKEKIFKLLVDDNSYGIIGVDSHITKTLLNKYPNLIPVSISTVQDKGVAIINNQIHDRIGIETISIDLPINKSLQGAHNHQNIAASYAVCRLLGISPQLILSGITNFPGLAHRMEYIGSVHLKNHSIINFYNDSKATNGEAASKSITILDNIYWLAGGIAKMDGIQPVDPFLHKVNSAYFFGKDQQLFANSVSTKINTYLCDNLESAFNLAFSQALRSPLTMKNILLAPAAASFDQFQNFEERGEVFRKLCLQKIAKTNNNR